MKTSILTSASLSLLFLLSFVQAAENDTYDENDRIQSLMLDPKFKPNTLGNIIPGRYIIEFDEDYHGSSLDFVNDVEIDISNTYPGIKSRIKMSIHHDFNSKSAIFRGVSISLQEVQDNPQFIKRQEQDGERDIHTAALQNAVLRKIMQQHRVKHIYPVIEIPRPKVDSLSINLDAYMLDADNNTIPKIPNVQILKGGPMLPFTHTMTQVNKVHEDLKFKGKGVVVGIIDSGIDYRHPAFGGGFGPGYQVRYGYDLVGDKYNSRDPNSGQQGETPLDSCLNGNGHGTHVAGIIAANDKLFNFTGVASEVTLGAWRVFGCDGATSNDLVIKALIGAHEAGCDIINLSLGSASNWAEDPTAIVANRISEKGSIVIAAAGNDGADGAFYISSPGSGLQTIAVASVDNEYNLQQSILAAEGTEYPYLLSSSTKIFPPGLLLSYSNNNVNTDACDGLEPENDLNGKIVLVQRGKCTFDEKAEAVRKAGGVGIVLYDNQDEAMFTAQALKSKLPMASISQKAGMELKQLISTNEKYKSGIQLEFKTALTPFKTPTGNTMSKFSSVGPLYDMSFKPDVAGPGGYIFSTLPIANGGYGVLSGTSMAAPYIAGAYALYLEAHGKKQGQTYLKEHFQNYARPTLKDTQVDNPARQGAGLIQLFDAIQQPVHVSPGHISFNDTVNIKPQTLKITNPGKDTITYRIRHQHSLAIAPYNTTEQGFAPLQPPRYAAKPVQATLYFSAPNITVGPGETKELNLGVKSISVSADEEPYPIYGGFIEFSPINQISVKPIRVPYIGIRGSMAKLPIFGENFPRLMISNSTKLFESKNNETGEKVKGLVLDRAYRSSLYVTSMFRLLTGTPLIRTEVLDRNMTQIGLFSQEQYLTRSTTSDLDFVFTQRWNGTMIPNGTENLSDLISIEPGYYYLRWKALKLLSDPHSLDSWETKISPPIQIKN